MQEFHIYNTATQEKEKFEPVEEGKVKIYTCGPTVYSTSHIGNFRTFLFPDLLVRTLDYLGYETKHVMNITDVGHLTDDNNNGEDKIEKAAKKKNTTAQKIAEKYTKEFLKDMKRLNINKPDKMPKASEHIEEQIELIKALEEKGFTYKISDGIYFDTSKDKDYAKITPQDLKELEEGARVEENEEKKNPTDFALWKLSNSQEGKRLQEWDSPWGKGFPGWHIECSAMSAKYLGQPFDIHAGGEDLLFPHHANEQAQSTCAHDKPLANYWMHPRFLNIKKTKMAKSKGNFYTLQNVIDRGYEPYALRYFYMTAHYRTPADFSWGSLDASQVGLNNLRNTVNRWNDLEDVPVPMDLDRKFKSALSDDLNFPKALAVLWGLAKSGAKPYSNAQKKASILQWDTVLGLGLNKFLEAGEDRKKKYIPKKVRELVQKRENYRKQKRFEKADEVREKIEDEGFEVEDTKRGPVVNAME